MSRIWRCRPSVMPPRIERAAVEAAGDRLRGRIEVTPLLKDAHRGLWLKCEYAQITGSFKLRGALNRCLQLTESERERGVVAASAGNHGQGVAYAARDLKMRAQIVVPAGAVARKIEAIRALGAEVIPAEGGYAAAEAHGQSLAREQGAVWISPYNDAQVVAGQGTLGLEIEAQAERLLQAGGLEVYVPVGGGGLAAGIGMALDAWRPGLHVVGVLPEHSPYLHAFFHRGSMNEVVEKATLADGLAGAVEADSITLPLVRQYVDDMRLVTEDEIVQALRWAYARGHTIEPSAAVALAGALRPGAERRLVVLSGGNVDPLLWEAIGRHAQT